MAEVELDAHVDKSIIVQFSVRVKLWHRLCRAIDVGYNPEAILTAGMDSLGCLPEDPDSIHETIAPKFPVDAPVAALPGCVIVEDLALDAAPPMESPCAIPFRMSFWP